MTATTKRGRPPLDPSDRAVPVSLALPSKQYDELCRQARREGVSVPEIIRRTLRDRKDVSSAK
jgi:hypothetical protein